MYRYLALVWDTCEPPAASQAAFLQQRLRDTLPAWSQAMAAPGLAIFHIDAHQGAARSLLLPGARGAILGTLFPYCDDGEAVQATRALDEATASRIATDQGQSLLQGYWGRYVAIIKDADQPGVWVLRDPTGALPCLLAQWEGVHLVFADVEDGLAIAPVKVSIDWETLTAMLARRDVYLRTWALNGIGEVRPGERVRLSARIEHRHTAWNPLRIAAHQPVQDFGQAAGLLRRAVRTCVHSWAAQYSRIVLRLSGGLDSSIMLSTLSSARNGAELTCAHSFAGGAGEDERRYARLMASHVGANLVERNLDDHPVRLHDVLPARRTPRAFGYLFDLEHRRHLSALCARGDSQERHRGGLFSGSGGDGVFYQARAELAVADFLLRHGLHRGLARVAVDAARMSRRSIAHLLIDALRIRAVEKEARAMQLPPIPPSPLLGRGIGPADAIHGTPLQHPWLMGMDAEKIPPGKLWHALSAIVAPSYDSPLGEPDDPDVCHPYLSQPLFEACMRIPTYVLIHQGHDRAVPRHAFASDLPEAIVKRHHKGVTYRHLWRVYEHNLQFLRELLLEGLLVKNGLLNRNELERYLGAGHHLGDSLFLEILNDYMPMEVWLRAWVRE